MLKLLKVALCSALFVVGSNASDFLAKATNGILSDNAMGIKQLNASEMEAIKGGYLLKVLTLSNTQTSRELAVVAALHLENELGVVFNQDGSVNIDATNNSDAGVCPIGVASCFYNESTRTHLNQSRNRLVEFIKGLGGSYSHWMYDLAYSVKREIKISDRGTPYVLFSYGVGAVNRQTNTYHPINSSAILNDNMIVKELRDTFKTRMEQALGGWNLP